MPPISSLPGAGCRRGPRHPAAAGLTLLEVVVAIGIGALALVGVLGLFAATIHSEDEVRDRDAVNRLGGGIEAELSRLKTGLGWSGWVAGLPPCDAADGILLVGTRSGGWVRRADGPDPAADRSPDDPELPGIPARDRYFRIEVRAAPGFRPEGATGFVVVEARVSWPFRVPMGAATSDPSGATEDPSTETPSAQRRSVVLLLALRP
jgi:hypothetical protein